MGNDRTIETMLWRRLDTGGHDACRLSATDDGYRIDGAAVFLNEGRPARLAYQIVCDPDWKARAGRVAGWVGSRAIGLGIRRDEGGGWRMNGVDVPGVHGLADLDLGFTPATNVFPIRRLALRVGGSTEAPAAWLDLSDWTLKPLRQRYERTADRAYRYEAPDAGYAATLTVSPAGMVRRYPGLWEEEE